MYITMTPKEAKVKIAKEGFNPLSAEGIETLEAATGKTPEAVAGILAFPYENYMEVKKNGINSNFDLNRIKECIKLSLVGERYTSAQREAVEAYFSSLPTKI